MAYIVALQPGPEALVDHRDQIVDFPLRDLRLCRVALIFLLRGADEGEVVLVGDDKDHAAVIVLQHEGLGPRVHARNHDVAALHQPHRMGAGVSGMVGGETAHPGSGRIHYRPCVECFLLAAQLIDQPRLPHLLTAAHVCVRYILQLNAAAATDDACALLPGLKGIEDDQTGVIDPCIGELEAGLEFRKQRAVRAEAQGPRARQRDPPAQEIVQVQSGADHPARTQVGPVRQLQTQRFNNVRRLAQQHLTLRQSLAHQAKLVLLQIAQTAVDQLAACRGRRRTQVRHLAQRHVQTPTRGIGSNAAAVDTAADDQQVVQVSGGRHALSPPMRRPSRGKCSDIETIVRSSVSAGNSRVCRWRCFMVRDLMAVEGRLFHIVQRPHTTRQRTGEIMSDYILAIDQGTTSSRAIVFDRDGQRRGVGQEEFPQYFPKDGWVEHEPEEIWQTTLNSCRAALQDARLEARQIRSIGITNQRETAIVWDRESGEPIHRAIVWQDRRTGDYCRQTQQRLEDEGRSSLIQDKTGLLLDSYFSATKVHWMLENVAGAREAADAGKLAFGTVDSYLLWRLTAGKRHCTDATNASRTLLFNIHTNSWDDELLELFQIPRSMLPEVLDSAADFGVAEADLLGAEIPVNGVAGDQQAATFGQCCFEKGMAKSTYGTGCFMLLNTGTEAPHSENRLLTTIAYRLDGVSTYALEGSIFMAGATMQWLRDGLKLFKDAAESEALARQASDELSLMFVPAFTGLGAPYWDPDARGAIFGLTRDTGISEMVAAALMSVCYQTRDLQKAMQADGMRATTLRVDGGMAMNDFMLQNLADLLGCRVDRPQIIETTALGAAYLAGLHCGVYESLESISSHWRLDASFEPARDKKWRDARYADWQNAVQRTRSRQ